MSNDVYVNQTEWEKILNKKRREENKERNEHIRRLYLERSKEKIQEYGRLRTLRLRELREKGQCKFNVSTKSENYNYRPSNFVMKETPNDAILPKGKMNKKVKKYAK